MDTMATIRNRDRALGKETMEAITETMGGKAACMMIRSIGITTTEPARSNRVGAQTMPGTTISRDTA
jgi:hypothetical protein